MHVHTYVAGFNVCIHCTEESNSSEDEMSYDEDDESEGGQNADHYESLVNQLCTLIQ